MGEADRNVAKTALIWYNKTRLHARSEECFMQTFAEQLNAVRKERHITQEQLAQEMSVSRTTISRWESGVSHT